MLVAGRLSPLALVLLAPLVVNILLYHATINPNGLPLAGTLAARELYLAFQYRAAFAFPFQVRPTVVPAGRTGLPEPSPTPIPGPAPATRSS
jgi:hypothetical protein